LIIIVNTKTLHPVSKTNKTRELDRFYMCILKNEERKVVETIYCLVRKYMGSYKRREHYDPVWGCVARKWGKVVITGGSVVTYTPGYLQSCDPQSLLNTLNS